MNCSGNWKNVRIMKNNFLFLKESQAGNTKTKQNKKLQSYHYYAPFCGF